MATDRNILRNIARETSFAPNQRRSSISKKITMLVAGDSIANIFAEPNDDNGIREEFVSYLALNNVIATIFDGAQGGQDLYDFYDPDANDGAGGKGSKWINLWDIIPGIDDITDFHFTDGANSVIPFAQGTYTKAVYKADLQGLIDLTFATYPNLRRFYMRLLGRYVNDGSVNYPSATEDIRNLQMEIAAENDNVYLLPPYYDEPQVDHVHPTLDTYDLMARRDADRIANVLGLRNAQGLGMTMASASVSDLGIDITVNFDEGNDITVPPTSGEGLDFFRIDDAVNFQRIDKINNNTFRLYGGAPYLDTPTIKSAFGQMFDLGLVPEAIQENGDYKLPILPQQIVATNTRQNTDVISQISDLKYYSRPELFARRTTTGNNFDQMRSIDNSYYELWDGADDDTPMVYDSTLFGGVGGFKPSADGAHIRGADQLLNGSTGWMCGFTIEMEDTISSEQRQIFRMASDAGGFNNARIYSDSGNRWILARADDLGFPILESLVAGKSYAVIINCISQTEMDIYINSATVDTAVDPRADFLSARSIMLGDNENNGYGMSWASDSPHDTDDDPSIAAIMNYMKSQYNIT